MATVNSFGSRTALAVGGQTFQLYSLPALEKSGFGGIARMPYSMKILLENLLRHEDGRFVKAADVEALARWDVKTSAQKEISFTPARVLLQDFTGVPAVVDLAAMRVVMTADGDGGVNAYPDTLVGTDSHTTMVNGLGVVGWGVGGIEAEACMLGQPISMLIPQVLGFRLTGTMLEGATATDLVLTITERLRKHGVVGKFVEFFGAGLEHLTIADRATLGNMCPEYGATIAIFPIDEMTLDYLRLTGRDESRVQLVEAYARAQGLFLTAGDPDPRYTETIELDLSTVEPSLAGPERPQDRVSLKQAKSSFQTALGTLQARKAAAEASAAAPAAVAASVAVAEMPPEQQLDHGAVVIA